RPGPAVALTAMPQLRVPQAGQPNPKGKQAVEVPRYRVVVEVALHDRLEPLLGFRHRVMPASLELLLDLAQLGPQTLGDGPALHGKVPLPVLPAHMREPQKVERFRLPFSSPFPVRFGIPPELDPARFIRMQLQVK